MAHSGNDRKSIQFAIISSKNFQTLNKSLNTIGYNYIRMNVSIIPENRKLIQNHVCNDVDYILMLFIQPKYHFKMSLSHTLKWLYPEYPQLLLRNI